MLLRLLQNLSKKLSHHKPLIEILIYRENLLNNLLEYKRNFSGFEFAPVLKSNAYGHGLIEVAKIFDNESLPFFVVDSYYEALNLRSAGIKNKILIIGFTREENVVGTRLKNVCFAVTSLEWLKKINGIIKTPRNIHLKIDTGMHRQGILKEELKECIEIIKNNKNFVLEGICSHLFDAENESQESTLKQINLWNETVDVFKKEFPDLKYFHLSASAGVRFLEKTKSNVVRLGLGLYGFGQESASGLNLKPALEMNTIITGVKNIGAGESVGYGASFVSSAPMKIATIPAGYFEGIDRRLSNIGFVKVAGRSCPIVGRVSMNICAIDVSEMDSIQVGDRANIISKDNDSVNNILNIFKQCQTIPYEILVHIPAHLSRRVI